MLRILTHNDGKAHNRPENVMRAKRILGFVCLVVIICLTGRLNAQSSKTNHVDRLSTVIKKAVDGGSILGAQVSIGDCKGIVRHICFGRISLDGPLVDCKTQFCIGSCSKPIAAAIVLRLVEEDRIQLDDRIDQWLPEFGHLLLKEQAVPRAPTIRELLAHRGGIYSQRSKLSTNQIRAIRDFSLSLEQSVSIIASQPLIAIPGKSYAYSGAGYCVLGRAAERAGESSFNNLLYHYVCEGLGLNRTTYFPSSREKNIAVAGMMKDGEIVPNTLAPHVLGSMLKLPLIGGGIYSTSSDLGRFARAMLNTQNSCGVGLLADGSLRELRRKQFSGQSYGLGWSLEYQDGKAIRMMHAGSLHGSKAWIGIDIQKNTYVAVVFTMSGRLDTNDRTLMQRIRSAAGFERSSQP